MLGIAAIAVINGAEDRALSIYRQLLSVNGDDPLVAAAMLQLATHTNTIAEEVISHIERLPGTSAALSAVVASHYSMQRQWSQAMPFYINAAAVESSADFLYNFAVCLEHLGQHKQAARRYTQALEARGSFSFDRESVLLRLSTINGR